MSKTATIILILVAALVFMGVGFAVGQIVQAALNTPGGLNDPIVSESYVETAIVQRVAPLQTQIEELQAQIDALVGGGTTPTSPVTEPSAAPSTPDEPTTPAKKVVVTSSSALNIRADATTNSERVGSAAPGAELEYLETKVVSSGSNGTWYKVRTEDGVEGWVAGWLSEIRE